MVANRGKKEDKLSRLAYDMARSWTDEVLNGKSPEDLIRSYGIDDQTANRILLNERTRRQRGGRY